MAPYFSIITVSLNSGPALLATAESVMAQDFESWELIIKDGGSHDGSLELVPSDPRIRIVVSEDDGIYDAMNQGLALSSGCFLNFLNAGDEFYDSMVLSSVYKVHQESSANFIYGFMFNLYRNIEVRYPSLLSGFFLFRNTICHQAQFIDRSMLVELRGYDVGFSLRADYDFYLRARNLDNFISKRLSRLVVKYDGNGVSASSGGADLLDFERQVIIKRHFSCARRVCYSLLHELSMVRLRKAMNTGSGKLLFRSIHERIHHFFNR
jgi:glycosyltransferase involved in cell wall biosynthesis